MHVDEGHEIIQVLSFLTIPFKSRNLKGNIIEFMNVNDLCLPLFTLFEGIEHSLFGYIYTTGLDAQFLFLAEN